jgi:DNA-binding NarL/FixJ family response regulator
VVNMTRPANGDGDPRSKGIDRTERPAEPRRIILFVVPAGTISESLVHALERDLPWIVVELVENVRAGCATFEHSVALILVDPSLLKTADQASSELTRLHPQALTAVIQRDDFAPVGFLHQILESPIVRGVLPMNLRLDVWLSVIRLMLCGGGYFPPDMCHAFAKRVADIQSDGVLPAARNFAGAQISELTAREIQILERVSRGLQNKSIAAEFNLSEHTVKIHLHNIISKLGAHNRTEAVARFRHLQEWRKLSAGNGYLASL